MADDDRARAQALLRREANVASLVPYEPTRSSLGAITIMGEGEEWPGGANPMAPLLQINLSELPVKPDLLADLEYLCFWLPSDDLPNSTPNGEGWEVRAYRSGARLQAIEQMPVDAQVTPHGLAFVASVDFPDWDDASSVLERAGIDRDFEWYHENLPRPREGIKVGGWPFLVQSEIYWAPWNRHPANPRFVLQVDSLPEIDIHWGDEGLLYVGRGDAEHRDIWALEWQCY